jgi:hypothetical protein
MAYRDSGDFFDDITDEQWKLVKDRFRNRKNHFRDDPNHPQRQSLVRTKQNLNPTLRASTI